MIRIFFIVSAFFLLTASSCAGTPAQEETNQNPADMLKVDLPKEHGDHGDDKDHDNHNEPRPYDAEADAKADVEATLTAARESGKLALIVMGANWCHDSRGLAAHFESEEFKSEIITPNYELLYIDVGEKDRNEDISARFGVDDIVGTPTVFIVTGEGEVLNLETAPTWRNAASRTREEIEDYFQGYASEKNP